MRIAGRVRPALLAAALAAVAVAWATVPAGGGRLGLKPVLIAALACAIITVGRLLIGPSDVAQRETGYSSSIADFIGRQWNTLRRLPWPQGLLVAVLGLEALHPSRPWHTALLGVVLLGFLLAVHLAEATAGPSVFRPHLPLLATGLGLAGLSAGAAMLPALGATSGSGLVAVIAAIAAVVVAALALPL
ncbi:MAG: hypothetical protein LBV34_15615 [Nocardiopsaceae bacterium]|jgi:hypothetical protein|nr:hypothetical protein [Nocardiopsaceae bacterium]